MRLLRRLCAIWCLAESHNCNARLAGASTDDYRSTVLHMAYRDFGNPSSCCDCITLPPPFLLLQSRIPLPPSGALSFRPRSGYGLSTSQAQIDIPESPRARRWRTGAVITGPWHKHSSRSCSSSSSTLLRWQTPPRDATNDSTASCESRLCASDQTRAELALTELAVLSSMHDARVLLYSLYSPIDCDAQEEKSPE